MTNRRWMSWLLEDAVAQSTAAPWRRGVRRAVFRARRQAA